MNARNNKNKKGVKHQGSNGEYITNNNKSKAGNKKEPHPPCQHCGGKSHPHFKYWRRPDAKCTKCNRMRHEVVILKNKNQQHGEDAQVDDQEGDQLFVATCFFGMELSESWLIDNGCTNHMTQDKDLFRELRNTNTLTVRIGNDQYITLEGKRTIAISSCSGTKLISDVLYVFEIDQNLLSVGQLIENDYKVVFEDKSCLIKDVVSQDIFRVKMRRKSFALNPLEEEQIAFPIKENIIEV